MNNDKIDQLVLENEKEKFIAYILGEIQYNNSVYIYYVRELKNNYNIEDIYVGMLNSNGSISSVPNEVLSYLEDKIKKIINFK